MAARNHLTTKDFSRAAVGAVEHVRRRAPAQPDRVRDDEPAHRRSGPDQGGRLLGHQPGQHQPVPRRARRRLPGRRACWLRPAGSTAIRPPCRRSLTRWWRRCTGSTPTAPRRSPARCRRTFVNNGLTTKATTPRARGGQGSVPPRRDDARERAADRASHREVHRQRDQADEHRARPTPTSTRSPRTSSRDTRSNRNPHAGAASGNGGGPGRPATSTDGTTDATAQSDTHQPTAHRPPEARTMSHPRPTATTATAEPGERTARAASACSTSAPSTPPRSPRCCSATTAPT